MSDSYHEQELDRSHTPSLPLISHSNDSPLVTGIDWSLGLLLLNALITVFWGIVLIVFQTGIVPQVSWDLSYHQGLVNVIVTGIATVSTSHLHFTIQNMVLEYSALLLHQGFTLRQWAWMQEFARGSIWPPFTLRRYPVAWPLWLLVYGLMAAHSASLVAILQPQSRWGHVMFNDSVPCGVDANTLTLNLSLIELLDEDVMLSNMDGLAEQVGMQLGSYYYQVAANTTTVGPAGSFIKDNFGYGALIWIPNGLQEVPGVEIVAECESNISPEVNKLAMLWSAAFPGQVLPAPTITNGYGTFGVLPESTSQQAVITSAPIFNLTESTIALYAIVNASGGGGLLTVDASGYMWGCTWTAVPRLVHLQYFDRVVTTISADNATTFPLPTGHAVYTAVQGMARAVNLGGVIQGWVQVYPENGTESAMGVVYEAMKNTLQTLLADALKGALTLYTIQYAGVPLNPTLDFTPMPVGVSKCNSNNRELVLLWHFGNEHNLGWIAIGLLIGFGVLALYAVWHLRTRARIKGLNALKVVDAFKLGVDTADVKVEDGDRVLYVRSGWVMPKPIPR